MATKGKPAKVPAKREKEPPKGIPSETLVSYAPHRVGFALARLAEGQSYSEAADALADQFDICKSQAYKYVAAARQTMGATLTLRRDVHRKMQRGTLWGIVLDALKRAELEVGREYASVAGVAVSALADLRRLDKLDFDPTHDLGEGQEIEDPETVRLVVEILESMRSKAPDLVEPYLKRIKDVAR